MTRRALILLNTAKNENPELNVDGHRVNEQSKFIDQLLTNLGLLSFSIDSIINPGVTEGTNKINELLEKYSNDPTKDNGESCLLFYYFGHSILRDNDLCFCFKDTKENTPSTYLPFNEIVRRIFGFNINNVLFVLDSCYSGAAQKYNRRTLDSMEKAYAFLCSAIPTQKAKIKPGKTPFGLYSYNFFNGFRDPKAIDPEVNAVTVNSLASYIEMMLSNREEVIGDEIRLSQIPFYFDNNLGNFILAKNNIRRNITHAVNTDAPQKSYYSKYKWIGEKVFELGQVHSEDLYELIDTNKIGEFQRPKKDDVRNVTYLDTISIDTLYSYIDSMGYLGILELNVDPLRLTNSGRGMFEINQTNYNSILFELISAKFDESGMPLVGLEKLIHRRISRKSIPSSNALYKDAINYTRFVMNKNIFSICLDLLSYIGYIRLTTSKTYYPYW